VKRNRISVALFAMVVGIPLLAASGTAAAYVGPGAGLGLIGSLFAVVGGVLLALLGIILFPIRLLMKRFRKPDNAGEQEPPAS
jgi:hypothetical protein